MKYLLVLHITLLVGLSSAFAQIEEIDKSELRQSQPDSTKAKEFEKYQVYLWEEARFNAFSTITNDSLLRWNIYPNWGDFYAYRRDALSFRQGTMGRIDAYHVKGYRAYDQNVKLDGISMNNPITSLVNYNYIPHHKIGRVEERYAAELESNIYIRDYYITEPISYLNFDESTNDYRNLEFMVAQNTSPTTNIELSYWDRHEGGTFINSEADGSQVLGRVYHHMGNHYLIRGMILRNQWKNDESGGYLVIDPKGFAFDEFTSSPNSSSGSSETLRTDMQIGLYHRSDSLGVELAGVSLTRSKIDHAVDFKSDSIRWELNNYDLNAFKLLNVQSFSLKGEAGVNYSAKKSGSTISLSDWLEPYAKAEGSVVVFDALNLWGSINHKYRDTKHSSTSISSGLKWAFPNNSTIEVGIAQQSKMPTIQTLYWNSASYNGNEQLKNENEYAIFGSADFKLGSNFQLGGSSRFSSITNEIGIGSDSTFTQVGDQDLFFANAFVRFENHRFELETSAVYETTMSESLNEEDRDLNYTDTKLWLRNNAFLKGYAFDRAAYIKMGVRTTLSPLAYRSQFYNTALSYWQPSRSTDGNETELINSFFRMDVELSARVRAIMVVIRMENALDGIGQAGYFESTSFPMSPRRLIVGIRAQFRN